MSEIAPVQFKIYEHPLLNQLGIQAVTFRFIKNFLILTRRQGEHLFQQLALQGYMSFEQAGIYAHKLGGYDLIVNAKQMQERIQQAELAHQYTPRYFFDRESKLEYPGYGKVTNLSNRSHFPEKTIFELMEAVILCLMEDLHPRGSLYLLKQMMEAKMEATSDNIIVEI